MLVSADPMRRHLFIVLLASASILGGCGGSSSNGEADKAPSQIFNDAKKALAAAGSFRVSGTASGTTVALRIGKHAAAGTLSVGGHKVELVRIGDVLYVRAPAGFWTD